MDNLFNKAEDALGKFLDDPEKVAKAKEKSEDMLAKRMDRGSAEEVVDKIEEALRAATHHDPPSSEHNQEEL